MPINCKLWITVVTAGIIAFLGQNSIAAPSGHGHHPPSHVPGHQHQTGQINQNALPAYANSWPYLRAENGIFGPVWAAPGPGSSVGGAAVGGGGYGGVGYGAAGWGGGYGFYDYDINPPYFDFFPPVYYSYNGGAVAPTASPSAQSQGNGAAPGQEFAMPSQAQPSRPLIIVNPYFKSGK